MRFGVWYIAIIVMPLLFTAALEAAQTQLVKQTGYIIPPTELSC